VSLSLYAVFMRIMRVKLRQWQLVSLPQPVHIMDAGFGGYRQFPGDGTDCPFIFQCGEAPSRGRTVEQQLTPLLPKYRSKAGLYPYKRPSSSTSMSMRDRLTDFWSLSRGAVGEPPATLRPG